MLWTVHVVRTFRSVWTVRTVRCSSNVNCSHGSLFALFVQRELFARFAVRTVRPVWTVRTVRCSHCSHTSNCSHCSLFALFAQFGLFAQFVVRTVRTISLVRTVRCSHCSVRTVRTSEQRTRLFAVRWTLLIGFFRPYRPSCSALVAYGSLILDKAQNWEFPTTWMNMNYWSQKATAGSPERVTKNNVWIIFFDNQPLKPHPYCIKTTTFLRVHMNPLLVINYTVS